MTPHVRDLAVKALNERFDSETEIATLQVSIFPQPEVSGTGLVVRHKGRRDVRAADHGQVVLGERERFPG